MSVSQPVILLSPAPPILENDDYDKLPSPSPSLTSSSHKPFASLTRKLSNLSLRSSPPSPRPGTLDSNFLLLPDETPIISSNILSTPTISSSSSSSLYLPPSPSSACSTPTSERAQPSCLQDKYKNHRKGKTIGRGATAKLRLLTDENDKKVVAIKTFRKRDGQESRKGYDKRMTSEFCISKTLGHRHVIQVYDLLKDKKGRWCTVMEYCAGGDVFSILQQFDLTDAEIDCLFKQLLLGVQHIHASGVAHRDIKPENLVMTTEGILKIADFGVADVVQSCFDVEPRLSQGHCGSEPYWSPELFANDEYDGRALDVWSCAVTWHCLIYRQIPFFKASKEDPQYVIYTTSPKDGWLPLSKCNQDEKECLYGMFDPNPVTRWTIDQCVASNWIQSIHVCYESLDKHVHHLK
ncbi:unnamed protein product [Mucor fragilis]